MGCLTHHVAISLARWLSHSPGGYLIRQVGYLIRQVGCLSGYLPRQVVSYSPGGYLIRQVISHSPGGYLIRQVGYLKETERQRDTETHRGIERQMCEAM